MGKFIEKLRSFLKPAAFAAAMLALVFAVAACKPQPAGSGTDPGGNPGDNPGQTDTDTGFKRPDYGAAFYDNLDFHNYGTHTGGAIEGQWPGYGVGDPFIMRYNGTYYLYVSTLDSENGVRAWKSPDLLRWSKCTGAGLPEGYVADPTDYTSRAAYAPEVYYFDGVFYMYMSPAGNGHYIYTATDPEGPFVRVTDNFGQSIDGSVLIDDDESMYFTRADNGGIRILNMSDMGHVTTSGTRQLANTNIGGWTEGSYVLKRNGVYYITYTGIHVASDGYRVSYAWADENDLGGTGLYAVNAFNAGIDLPTLLSTDDPDFRGLGHSSTVLGPDMDGYYMAYHNLNNSGGPNRSLNIDRILFNGNQMAVAGTPVQSVAPRLPVFYAGDTSDAAKFDLSEGAAVSKESAGAVFTAEFNFKGADAITLAVNYKDAQNYDAIDVDLTAKTVLLSKVEGGAKAEIASGAMTNGFNAGVLHTVRYAQGEDGKADVYFDNMRKIADAEAGGGGGKIAYLYTGSPELKYTAFSDVAHGLSDRREIKQAQGNVGASLYSPDAGMSKFGEGSGIGVVDGEESAYRTAATLTLANTGDYATYYANFKEDGYYGMELTYPRAYAGKKVKVTVDEEQAFTATLPDIDGDSEEIRAYLDTLLVWKGINQVRVEAADGEIAFISFTFFPSTLKTPAFEHDLCSYMPSGADYRSIWKLEGTDGGHRATAGTRQLVYIGDSGITDFTLEIEMMLKGATGTGTAGIVFRAGNYAASNHDTYTSLQGYYLSLNNSQIRLGKLNYNDERIGLKAGTNLSDEYFTLKIVARGGNFKVYKGEELVVEADDALGFAHGRIGLYTNGAEACFRQLKITA
jgi:hypothetical protein